jgi:hypothetical protein
MQETTLQPQTPPTSASGAPASPEFRAPVDPEHAALRLAIVGVFVGLSIVGYLVANAIFQGVGFNIIALIVALGAGIGGMQVVDGFLKRRWPSGRALEIQGDAIRLTLRGKTQREINGAEHVNVLFWRFEIRKRARAPKGWYVVALALLQDDDYLPAYTFVSPEDYKTMPYSAQYVRLSARKEAETDMRLAGQQRRLLNAEAARWNEGAEMAKADFDAYVALLKAKFPVWMPAE